MSRAGYVDNTAKTIEIGYVFQWSKNDDDWMFTLIIDSYHVIDKERFKSQKLAQAAMEKEYLRQTS